MRFASFETVSRQHQHSAIVLCLALPLISFTFALTSFKYREQSQSARLDEQSKGKEIGVEEIFKNASTLKSTKLHVLPARTGKSIEISTETSLQILHLISGAAEFVWEESEDDKFVSLYFAYELRFELGNGNFLSLDFDDNGRAWINAIDCRDINGITSQLNSFFQPYGIELRSNEDELIDYTKPTSVQMFHEDRNKDFGFWIEMDLEIGSSIIEKIHQGKAETDTVALGLLAQKNMPKVGVIRATFSEKRTYEIQIYSHETWAISRGNCLIFNTSSQSNDIAKLLELAGKTGASSTKTSNDIPEDKRE